MTEENNIYQSAEPCIELIQTAEGPVWEVSGNGLVSRHKQLWQALLRYDCMCLGKGISPSNG
jgi:hypothetical protein